MVSKMVSRVLNSMEDIHEVIDPHLGEGESFVDDCGANWICLEREEFDVMMQISTWRMDGGNAQHFYAHFWYNGLDCKNKDTGLVLSSCSGQPEYSRHTKIQVQYPAKKRMIGEALGGRKFVECEVGEPTYRFDTIEECIEQVRAEFDRIFGNGKWILRYNGMDDWGF